MRLTGDSFIQVRDAIVSAFSINGLRSKVRFELDMYMDEIAAPQLPLPSFVEELIRWAENQDRLPELLAGALQILAERSGKFK